MAQASTAAPAAPPAGNEKGGTTGTSEKTGPKGKKGKKGKKWLLLAVVFVIVAAGGGGAAYWKWSAAGSAAHDEDHAVVEAEPGLVKFEPFLVNLADSGGQAYLRVTLSLIVANEEQATHLEEKVVIRARIRSSLLEELSARTAGQLVTAEGKTELRKAIVERITSLKEPVDVRDVLFTDFVVQY